MRLGRKVVLVGKFSEVDAVVQREAVMPALDAEVILRGDRHLDIVRRVQHQLVMKFEMLVKKVLVKHDRVLLVRDRTSRSEMPMQQCGLKFCVLCKILTMGIIALCNQGIAV